MIDLRLGLLRLRLSLRIGRGPDDGARGTAENQSGARITRPGDNGTDNGTGDGPYGRARSRGVGRLNDYPLVGAGICAAGIHPGLLDCPNMAFIAVAFSLLRALPVSGVDVDTLRLGLRCRHHYGAGGRGHAGCQ